MKAIVIEDRINDKLLFEKGISTTNLNFQIIDISSSEILESYENNILIDKIGADIDLFIIDVGLIEGQDETGLKILSFLKTDYPNKNFKYIITSIWDRSEFDTQILIPDECFIDKNNFMGGELIFETKCKVINLFIN